MKRIAIIGAGNTGVMEAFAMLAEKGINNVIVMTPEEFEESQTKTTIEQMYETNAKNLKDALDDISKFLPDPIEKPSYKKKVSHRKPYKFHK